MTTSETATNDPFPCAASSGLCVAPPPEEETTMKRLYRLLTVFGCLLCLLAARPGTASGRRGRIGVRSRQERHRALPPFRALRTKFRSSMTINSSRYSRIAPSHWSASPATSSSFSSINLNRRSLLWRVSSSCRARLPQSLPNLYFTGYRLSVTVYPHVNCSAALLASASI